MLEIKIARDFSNCPGGRYRNEGFYSGEEFRDKHLYPSFIACEKMGEKLILDFDGGYGYSSPFLEEAFGGLARKVKNYKSIINLLEFKSDDEPSLVDRVKNYIEDANNKEEQNE